MMLHSNKEPVNEFWDINDLSCYLKVKVKTLYAMVPDIPHYRVGKLIRFRKQEIDCWLESKRATIWKGNSQSKKKRESSEKNNIHIDKLIRKAIDQTREDVYNPKHGKPDHIKGLERKEVNNGSI